MLRSIRRSPRLHSDLEISNHSQSSALSNEHSVSGDNQDTDQATMAITTAETWTENPNHGNFNPGTIAGNKIFQIKTKGLEHDKRLSFEGKNAPIFRRLLEAKEPEFGGIVSKVPTDWDAAGAVIIHKNLVSEYSAIDVEVLQRNALARFDTAIGKDEVIPSGPYGKRTLDPANVAVDKVIFYERVDSNVVAEWLKNVLDETSYGRLLLKKSMFSFLDASTGTVSLDGPTMLKIALAKFDPNVVVGIEIQRQKLETIKLHTFKNNVDEMCDEIEGIMKMIMGCGKDCESIRRYTITALLSGPNAKFNSFIDRLNDDIESQTGVNKAMDWRDIIDAARIKYNNMNSANSWDTVDPRDAKLLALTTQIETLQNANQGTSTSTRKESGANDPNKVGGVAKWRTIKNKGETCEWNGTTWYWCTRHVHPTGEFNGLYCTHKPEEHDDWKATMKAKKPWKPNHERPAAESNEAKKAKSLSVSEKLKSVLCTKLMLSDEDAEEICKECQEN